MKALSLKTKLILAFSFVAIISIASIVIYANLDSSRRAEDYVARGGMYGLNNLVLRLEKYYQSTGSWDGISHAVSMGQMMVNRGNSRGESNRLALVDKRLQVVWSSIADKGIGGQLTSGDVKNAIALKDTSGNITGYLVVENASNVTINDINPLLNQLRGIFLIAGLIAAAAAVGMAVLISNQLLKPVKELTDASAKLSAGDLSTRVEVDGSDELAVMGKTFNQMAISLETTEERKKAFTADIAHELRTPLAVQKAQLEAMMDGVIPLDKENLATVAAQSDFLSRMVEDLRLLAMADAGELKLEYQETQIDDLVQRIIDQFKGQAQKVGSEIIYTVNQGAKGIKVDTDPDRLTQIIHNLIGNALRYGKKGGVVEANLRRESDQVLLTIHDDGQGIPEDALPHLFERFYRHEKARSRNTGGTGLGLAISKKLALLLGGDLNAENHPQGGGIFTLVLPLQNRGQSKQ